MRLDGNQIDLTKPITFKFNNKFYQGYHGDTLASALLASGVKLVGRSFKYHRPRGILSAGAEEPNALVEVGTGAYLQPNVRATMVEIYEGLVAKSQNCWPNVNYDLGATASLFSRILPAGFYYKTFMWPSQAWLFYERFIRKAAGLGKASELKDPDQYTQRHAHCDLLIAGGGLSGLAAALNAKRSNLRVIIVDEQSSWGGFAKSESLEFDQIPICQWIQKTVDELSQAPHVTLLNRTTLSGYFDQNFLTALERVRDHLPAGQNTQSPRQRFWKIRAKHVILAQGAIERPLVFPQNDTPSIMMAGSVATYLKCYGVANAHSCLVYTNNNSAYQSAIELHHAGVQVTIADQRPDQEKNPHPLVKKAFSEGLVIHSSVYVDACHGKKTLKNVSLKYFDQKEDSQTIEIACDLLAMSGGWVPSVHLFSQAKGKLKFAPDLHAFLPDICHQKLTSVGACNGIFNPLKAILHAQSSVQKIARTLGFKVADIETIKQARLLGQSVQSIYDFLPVWTNPIFTKSARYKKQFIDFQNDVTVADIHLAHLEGYQSIEHLKRYTTTGMATDQGKTSNLNALSILAELKNLPVSQIGTTTFRPPYTPVDFGAVVGQKTNELFMPKRTTPMHPSHLAEQCIFEDVGDWKRPFCFTQKHETIEQAVRRECMQARQDAGLLDASTLGKIDIQGKDAGQFLDLIYTNLFSKLAIGSCRYGLMLNEHGMVFDDGVTTRLAENHYHMTTTTGGAANVLNWLEMWLQTEWPDLKVYCASVTEQWAVATLSGPKARDILTPLCEFDISHDAFKHMTSRTGKIAGVEGRIFRISFTGDTAFEINVPARFGHYLWQTIRQAGKAYDLCLYGTQAMHVLRAEKGYIIVGQDSDGTMTADDLGLNWIISKKKEDFLGKRSLIRSDIVRKDRKQLVGILVENQNVVLPEGAHLVETLKHAPPMHMLGHITSSYYSPTLKRSFALAVVQRGRERIGEHLYVPLMNGHHQKVKLVNPVFFDPENKRLN